MYFVYEKLGLDLFTLRNARKLSLLEIAEIARDVAMGLMFLHKQSFVHCDIKPENLMTPSTGNIFPIKIIDFDLCIREKLFEKGDYCPGVIF